MKNIIILGEEYWFQKNYSIFTEAKYLLKSLEFHRDKDKYNYIILKSPTELISTINSIKEKNIKAIFLFQDILSDSYLNNKTILDIMSIVTNSVSIGDVIETNIYSDQNWFLQNIHGFYTCVNTSYTMNNIKNNKQLKTKFDYDLVFSADLNKTSSKNINKKKNISMLQLKFKNKNIDDILYINKILYELEKNKNTSIIKSLKNTYKLDNKNIQIALKIDKTNIMF
jgi:hypothetical protein